MMHVWTPDKCPECLVPLDEERAVVGEHTLAMCPECLAVYELLGAEWVECDMYFCQLYIQERAYAQGLSGEPCESPFPPSLPQYTCWVDWYAYAQQVLKQEGSPCNHCRFPECICADRTAARAYWQYHGEFPCEYWAEELDDWQQKQMAKISRTLRQLAFS